MGAALALQLAVRLQADRFVLLPSRILVHRHTSMLASMSCISKRATGLDVTLQLSPVLMCSSFTEKAVQKGRVLAPFMRGKRSVILAESAEWP